MLEHCTVECERRPTCKTCGKTKAPNGRSLPGGTEPDYCTSGCSGYYSFPSPGHLFPGELDEVIEVDDE